MGQNLQLWIKEKVRKRFLIVPLFNQKFFNYGRN